MTASIDLKQLLPVWEQFRNRTDIAPIRDDIHYDRMIALLNALLEEASGDENHPAMSLAGKREFNIRQIRALGERFAISPATFV
ncbi:MAG: hypothetical protein A4S08_05655 [Proteobacteria bacterium SG_bin4]|nr:MAG: hypothetical protein A4S08_05655 [Proteobacteria bacterium SG_bin4]